MFSAPIEFNRQDEGHFAYGPRAWKVIEKYYITHGHYPYKKYNNKTVLTGPFGGTQTNNQELVLEHFNKTNNWETIYYIRNLNKKLY